jgi:glycosyltransferase involved in cell wall biosynthesis
MPKISVIVTSFNHAKYICEAIDSALNQSFTDFELIILDDASTDDSWRLISQYSDPRIKAFRNDVNGDAKYKLNNAITELGIGEYIAIHHSDDVWTLDKLEKQVAFLDAHSEIGAVFTNALAITEDSSPFSDENHFYFNIFNQPNKTRHEWLRFFFTRGNALCHPSVLIRKSCYEDCGLYRYDMIQVPDFDMWVRLCMKYEIHVLPERLVKFRVRDNEANASGNRPEARIRGRYEFYKVLQNYRKITNFEDLVKIFPSASKFYRAKETDMDFALAMVALEEKPFIFTQLFGQDILFEVISDPKRAATIKRLYNFDHKSIITLTGQHDVFSQEEITERDRVISERDGQIANLNQAVAERDGQIANLNQAVAERDGQIANLNQAVAEHDGQIANLNQAVAERDAAVRNFYEIRCSSSWKLTAPLRFFGHLVKGNFDLAENVVREAHRRMMRWVPTGIQSVVRHNYGRLLSVIGVMANSNANHAAISAIVIQRCAYTREALAVDPLSSPTPQGWTAIDISIVTYNSSRWIMGFVDSLIELDYPKSLLTVRFVDNSSTDSSLKDLHSVAPKLRAAGFTVEIIQQPNNGYGGGHNTAISKGMSPFCLVSNIDLTFESDALRRVVTVALADNERAAAWELRQKPYEHPKFYDPITGITNWNSHACILLRRSAIDQVGRYDETLFMYGEDVELSYRLRRAGFLLRYCPQAVVWHYCYESANQIKPIQYIGSTFANLYLRLKYGNRIDALSVPMLGLRLLLSPEAYSGSRLAVLHSLLKLSVVAFKVLLSRRHSDVHFPFHTWDYELSREGAFVEQHSLSLNPPLVSIITRTYRGREHYLRQALLSVAHQTYRNIEHIVVEDGGETMRTVVDNISQTTGRTIHFIKLDKLGRSAAGNTGLSVAKGRWCLFLDDDDLLFSEHVEVLVNTLLNQTDAVAAYSLAWEVITDSTRLTEGEYLELTHQIPSPMRQHFDYEVLKHHNFMAIQSVLFERRLFEERGGFEVDMAALEDWVLWLKYAHGNRYHYVPKVTSMYRTPFNPLDIAQRQKIFDDDYPKALMKLSSSIEAANRNDLANLS